jgi:hypothetical protein
MLGTPHLTNTRLPAESGAATGDRGIHDLPARLAGAGAATFVAVVVIQNVVRGSSAPANGASAEDVLAHYADHRGLTVALTATFVVGAVALATFVGGVMRRLVAGPRAGWAYMGYIGAVGVMSLFAALVGTEQALSVVATRRTPDLGAVDALWALHNSIFTVLLLSIALALVGLGRAGVAAGITPRVFDRLAPVGGALLASSAVAGPLIAAGDAMALFGLGIAGFAIWLAFVLSTARRLLAEER